MARIVAHICGLTLTLKRYIGKSPAVQWVVFHLKMQNRIKNGMLLNILSETKMNMTKESDILKSLLSICPHQRCTEDLRQIQEHLKKNSSFEHLPNEVQLQLCQIVIYQEYEAKSVIIKKGHWPMECYLVLSGKLAAISSLTAENSKSEILSEFEEGDFVGETCLLTNTHRPTTIVCKSDAELLMISKKDFDCILSDTIQEQFQGICNFLRAGTLVCENLDSNNLIIIRTVTSSARYGIELNSLEQGKIFGLVEKMKKPSDLHFRLISEGAECILIPTKIFLMEAPIISQEMAVELVNSYPSKGTIREHLIKKQAWNNYKAKVVTQQIKRNARIMSS